MFQKVALRVWVKKEKIYRHLFRNIWWSETNQVVTNRKSGISDEEDNLVLLSYCVLRTVDYHFKVFDDHVELRGPTSNILGCSCLSAQKVASQFAGRSLMFQNSRRVKE